MPEYGLGLGDGRLIDAIHGNDHWGGTWVNYTPTVTTSSGTSLTSYTAVGKYLPKGKLIYLAVNVNVVTSGTASGLTTLFATLPFQNIDRNSTTTDLTKSMSWNFAGHAVNPSSLTTLYALTGYTSVQNSINQLVIIKYDATGYVADTNTYLVSGFYGIT